MGLFKRDRAGGKVVWGIAFQWEKEQQQELVGSKVDAKRILTQRLREVREGTYSPEHKTGAVTCRMFAKTWGDKRTNKTARDDRTRLTKHFVPYLGDMKLEDVRPRHIIEWIGKLVTAKTIAPSSIHNVYGNVSTMFRDAVIAELIASTPCVIHERVLPPLPAKEPGIYEKPSVVKLLTHPDVHSDRRIFYWLAFFTGMRHGEIAGRRWKHIDWEPEPLASLDIRTQYNDQPLKSPDGEPRPRVAPIHPLLRAALEEWRDVGFPKLFGRRPRPEDFIVPSRRGPGHHKTVRRSLKNIRLDCKAADVPPLTFHRTRDTFISLCRRAGADKDNVRRITHNPKGDIVDAYTHMDWDPLCAAVSVINLPPLPEQSMSESMSRQESVSQNPSKQVKRERGGRDSKTYANSGNNGKNRETRRSQRSHEPPISSGVPEHGAKYVTEHTGMTFGLFLLTGGAS
jgi:integrase